MNSFIQKNHFKTRRKLLALLASLPFSANLFGVSLDTPNAVKIEMNGDLDDDLIIVKANETSWNIEDCLQMHNPSDIFLLAGRAFKSIHIPGYIEYNKTHTQGRNEVLFIALANEREEREPDKALLERTHYKSVELLVNSKELIPSMIPEKNDIPDYTTWFDPKSEEGAYNYYRVWENAIINLGIVVPVEGLYRIELINKNDTVSASIEVNVLKNKAVNPLFKESIAGPIQNHTLAEMDGGVFMNNSFTPPNDELVKMLCAHNVLITAPDNTTIMCPLPYPFPYLNRMFLIVR